MVSKEQVEELMIRYFPKCPLGGSDAGWAVLGIFKTYIQCKACRAKWQSSDFIACKELKKMMLWELPLDGKGADLSRKEYPISFWHDMIGLDTKQLEIEQLKRTE